MEEYGEWLCSHSQDVPDPGEVGALEYTQRIIFGLKLAMV